MQLPAALDAVDDAEKRRGEAGRHEDVEKGHYREASSQRTRSTSPRMSCRWNRSVSALLSSPPPIMRTGNTRAM